MAASQNFTCQVINNPNNGASSCSASFDSNVACTITCSSGYELTQGEANVTCVGTNSTSSNVEHVCTAFTCAVIANPLNGASSCSDSFTGAAACAITCKNGYGLTAGEASVTCDGANTPSSGVAHECTASCTAIAAPTNGVSTCSSSFTGATACDITCATGYGLSAGEAQVTCEGPDAPSSSVLPVCSVSCDVIAAPENGASSCSSVFTVETPCDITCDAGYDLTAGDAQVTCNSLNTPSSDVSHVCTAVICAAIAAPANGGSTCSSSFTAEGACNITCNNGYGLTGGVPSVTCDGANTPSNSETPVCSAICDPITAPGNGTSSCSSSFTAAAPCNITCKTDYELTEGVASVTCNGPKTPSSDVKHKCSSADRILGSIWLFISLIIFYTYDEI